MPYSQFSTYRSLESALPGKMPIAEKATEQVICLPIYSELSYEDICKICDVIKMF